MKLYLLLFTVFLVIVKAQNGLTPCGVGSAIYNDKYTNLDPENSYCKIPAPNGAVQLAGISQYYFNLNSGSGLCGACFQVVGPSGSLVVQIVEVCNGGNDCLQQDHAHFVMSPANYNVLANSTAGIYNLGYQMITCPNEPADQIAVSVSPDQQGSYQYYFEVDLSGFNVPIKLVEIQLSGTSGPYQSLKYQSNIWVFNKNAIGFSFPAKCRITSQTGQQIVFTATKGGLYYVPNFKQAALYGNCSTPTPSEYIYKDSLANGWNQNGWEISDATLTDQSSETGTNIAASLAAYGGLKLQSFVAFDTSSISAISFDAKANVSGTFVVFMGDNSHNVSISISNSWSNFTIQLSLLNPQQTETSISIQNSATASRLFVDNVKWVFSGNVSATSGGTGLVTMPPVTKPPTTGSATTTSDVTTASTTAQVTTTNDVTGSISSGGSGPDNQLDSSSSNKLTISITLLLVSSIFALF